MLKRIIAASLITTTLALTGIVGTAAADGYNDHDERRNAWSRDRDYEDSSYRKNTNYRKKTTVVVDRRIHRRVVNDTLPIRRLLDLDSSYRGYKVKSVAVKIRSNRSHGRIKLLVNGQVVDRERVNGENWITLRTDDDKTIGRNLRSLKLQIRGKVYIKDIRVKLKKPTPRRRHSNVNNTHGNRAQPKVTIINSRHIEDPVGRIIRLILKDIIVPASAL